MVGDVSRGGCVVDHELEKRPQALAGCVEVESGGASLRVRKDHGKVDLLLVGTQVQEQLVHGVEDFAGPRV